jgi:hypothetical protein
MLFGRSVSDRPITVSSTVFTDFIAVKKNIRIASGQGFWGDMPSAPVNQVKSGPIDYLVLDYLAEVTMSIMQKQRGRNPSHGYALDFPPVVESVLHDIVQNGVKIVTNAGGVNPHACKDDVLRRAKNAGYSIKVAVVDGDDIMDDIHRLIDAGHAMKNMDTTEPLTDIVDEILSANVYFGARPIVEALKSGADVVITGRVTDTGLTLGPMIHEFGWSFDDFDKMAAGTIAGHIIECGAQCSGGNFTDWSRIPDMESIGFPIIEAYPDGSFVVTKHEGTGGCVDTMTVSEQLLYEIGDPRSYITPDCVADFTSVQIEQQSPDRVFVSGIKGLPATDSYKVSISYKDGFKLTSTLVYVWPDALNKAERAGEILQKRAQALGITFDKYRVEMVGFNSCNEIPAQRPMEYNEVQLRVSATSASESDLNRFGREVAPLILTGPSGVTGFAGGRPKSSEIVAYWPALLNKTAVEPRVSIFS